jgi:hypothetical protein
MFVFVRTAEKNFFDEVGSIVDTPSGVVDEKLDNYCDYQICFGGGRFHPTPMISLPDVRHHPHPASRLSLWKTGTDRRIRLAVSIVVDEDR